MQTLKKVSMGRAHSRIKLKRFLGWFARKSLVFLLTFSLIFSQLFSIFIPHALAASSPWTQTDWVGGSGQTSWSDSTKYSSASSITDSIAGQVTLSATSGWCNNSYCNSSWKYRKKITFNNTDANLGVTSENLVNFPVLVKLSSSNIDYTKTQNSGQDIRFTDTDGSDLAYEIESWDETGTSWVWVKVPQIDINSSTDYIYLYYGNTSATDHQQATSVWDSNYKGVWHLKESSGTNIADSSLSGNNCTKVSATDPNSATGQFDGGQIFDGSNDSISMGDPDSLDFGTNSFTVSFWVKNPLSGRAVTKMCYTGTDGEPSAGWGVSAVSSGVYHEIGDGSIVWTKTTDPYAFTSNTWYGITIVFDRTNNLLVSYVNGALLQSSSIPAYGSITNTRAFLIGRRSCSSASYYNGSLDEVRVSQIIRSVAWIAANYKSESDSFNSYASEEPQVPSAGSLTSSIFDTELHSLWGTLTYTNSNPLNTSVSIKIRTSNNSDMSGATTFSSCNVITSGEDISSNNCVTDQQRYIQYQINLSNTDYVSTPTFQDISIAYSSGDNTAPAISLTALSPDPNNDNTPALSGTATDAAGTVSNVQFQMDSTSGSWTACTADDGSFNSATEAFTCTVSSSLSDGSHTMYVRATDSNSNTTASGSESSDAFTITTTGVSVSLTAISPDPGKDTTPTISGTATATIGTISNVQFQVDSITGTWSNCTATDGSFNAASENFSCTTSALSDGSHTIYVRSTDNQSNNSSNASDSFTVDTTNPASFDLDSPGNDSYTNSERPTFKWKTSSDATAGLSKYVLEINNPSIGSGQLSGDFTIDSIPTSRTTDYETNKYIIHYENFSDSDSTNNYISVYTKSHSDWGSSENDGKLREGRVSWKVKAVDNAGNETSSSRTLFVDKSSPKVEFTQVNDTPFSSSTFATTDKTPTIYGKITDSLSGGDSSQTQDENGPKIASGPKQVEIKVEKKEGLGYKLTTLYTINMDKSWYSCDNKEISDNSKQKCDKYLPFEYTSKGNLDLGTYKITLTGKDKADNLSSETTLTLNITTLVQITTPEEKKIIEEETKPLKPEERERVKEELEITKPVEPSALEKAQTQIAQTSKNILNTTGNFISTVFNGVGQGVRFTVDTTGKALTFVGDKIIRPAQDIAGQALAFASKASSNAAKATSNTLAALYNGTTSILAYVGQELGNGTKAVGRGLVWTGGKIGQGVSTLAQGTGNLLASIGQGIGNTRKTIGSGYNQLAQNAPGVTRTILTGIGNGVSVTANAIANATGVVATTTVKGAQVTASTIGTIASNTGNTIGNISKSIAGTTLTIAQNTSRGIENITSSIATTALSAVKNTGSSIASATQNTVSSTKKGIANLAFTIGERTDDISHGVGTTIIKIGYLFVPEPTKISDVTAVALSPTSVKISWKTNHPANGKVNWGYEDGIYEFEQQTDKRTSQHEFILTNLIPDTEYHYEVMSQNRNYVYDANRKFKTPAK